MDPSIIVLLIGTVFSAVVIGVTWSLNRGVHPPALWLLFFTEMWERFSFYGMRALLMLYMTKVMLMGDKEANLQYGAYNALVYATPLLGGWLADRYLGFRKSIVLGAAIMAMGHLVLAIPQNWSFFAGLGLLITGNGFFKPNISSFLGRFYAAGDLRKDTAYSIFYLGINIGAFLGGALCGYLGQTVNWHLGFGVAGGFMVLGLVVFVVFQRVLGENGLPPAPEKLAVRTAGISRECWIYAGAGGLVLLSVFLVQHHSIMSGLMDSIALLSLGYIFWLGSQEEKEARERLWAAVLLIVLSVAFWGFYEQSGGSLNLLAERNVDMQVAGMQLSSALVNNSINPFYIVALSPAFAWMWGYLIRKKCEPSAPVKFAFAFILLGLGYLLFVAGGHAGAASGLMPLLYFLVGYFFITVGELCLSPIGLSMVSNLSPARMVGLMMGVWFLATSFGHHLAGWIGTKMAIPELSAVGLPFTAVESMPIYRDGCWNIGLASCATGVLILGLTPLIRRWMHGVK